MVEAIAPPKRVRVIRTVPAEAYGPLDVVAVSSGELLAERLELTEARAFCRRWNTEHPAQWAAFQPTKSRKRWLDPRNERPAPSEDDIWTSAAGLRSKRKSTPSKPLRFGYHDRVAESMAGTMDRLQAESSHSIRRSQRDRVSGDPAPDEILDLAAAIRNERRC